MSVTLAAVSGASRTEGNKRVRVYTVTYTGNYATGGDTITAANVGMRKIEFVRMPAFVVGSTPTSGNYAALTYASDGTSVTVRLLEDAAGAAGTALGQEKTNAEAYVTGQAFRAEFVGY